MITFTLVTGSKHKLAEWQGAAPAGITLKSHAIDLPEIQSLDSVEIVTHKVKQAYAQLQKPVIVEDVAAGLEKLQGLPGPFIKFFNQRLGGDALYQLGGDKAVTTLTCTVAYYDGQRLLIGRGTIDGVVVASRGEGGFGFDSVFVPNGHSKTFAQMTIAEKGTISHRHLAIEDLFRQLKQL